MSAGKLISKCEWKLFDGTLCQDPNAEIKLVICYVWTCLFGSNQRAPQSWRALGETENNPQFIKNILERLKHESCKTMKSWCEVFNRSAQPVQRHTQISSSLQEASAAIGRIHRQSHSAVFSFSLYINTYRLHLSAWYMGTFTPLTVKVKSWRVKREANLFPYFSTLMLQCRKTVCRTRLWQQLHLHHFYMWREPVGIKSDVKSATVWILHAVSYQKAYPLGIYK